MIVSVASVQASGDCSLLIAYSIQHRALLRFVGRSPHPAARPHQNLHLQNSTLLLSKTFRQILQLFDRSTHNIRAYTKCKLLGLEYNCGHTDFTRLSTCRGAFTRWSRYAGGTWFKSCFQAPYLNIRLYHPRRPATVSKQYAPLPRIRGSLLRTEVQPEDVIECCDSDVSIQGLQDSESDNNGEWEEDKAREIKEWVDWESDWEADDVQLRGATGSGDKHDFWKPEEVCDYEEVHDIKAQSGDEVMSDAEGGVEDTEDGEPQWSQAVSER